MTDAISSVSSSSVSSTSSNSSSSENSTLKKLKEQLQALGVDVSNITTVAQAQQKLSEVQNSQSGSKKPQGNSSMDTIITNVKSLASKIGVELSDNDKPDDMMDKISTKISELTASAGTDETKKSEASAYETEYKTLNDELNQAKSAMNMTGATALGNYNKAALGLAA
jgi:hypothetical protein